MKLKHAFFTVAIVFVVICFTLGALSFWMIDPFNFRAPTDQKLLTVFHAHREAFDKLRQMVIEDEDRQGYFSESSLKDDKLFNESRRQEYKTLLSEIHPGLVVLIDGNGNVERFIFAGGGLSAISPGWLKGIEYVPGNYEKLGVVLPNLNDARKLPANVYLRPIEINWFLVYQRTDD